MDKRNRLSSFALTVACGLLVGSSGALGCDTAGVDATPYSFNQPNLNEMKWTAAVSEFSPDTLRIEFNSIN